MIKRSDSTLSVPGRRAKLTTLQSVFYYHQRPGLHPDPLKFAHGEHCIELLTGGRGWAEIEGRRTEVGPGDLLWHTQGDVTISASDFADPYRCLAVRFRSGEPRPVPRRTRWEEMDEVLQFTNQVVRLQADGAFDSGVLLRYILSRVHFQAELYQRVLRERGLPAEVQQVLDVINRRYAENLLLVELADAAGWSVAHLHDCFRKHLDVSPHQALIRRRMQRAREILASTNDPIKSVAAQCGFPNASAFCVQFRKATQLSPMEYRERLLFGGGSVRSGAARATLRLRP